MQTSQVLPHQTGKPVYLGIWFCTKTLSCGNTNCWHKVGKTLQSQITYAVALTFAFIGSEGPKVGKIDSVIKYSKVCAHRCQPCPPRTPATLTEIF